MKKTLFLIALTAVISLAKAQTLYSTGVVSAKQTKYTVKVNKGYKKAYVSLNNVENKLGKVKLHAPPLLVGNPEIIGLKVNKNQINTIVKKALGPELFQQLANGKSYLYIIFYFQQSGLIKEVHFSFPTDFPVTPQMIEDIELELKQTIKAKYDERVLPMFGKPAYQTMEYIPYDYSVDYSTLHVN
ncbi:hypothetical protein MUY27_00660 [Mucilaginibacter sp. RS28]|uniref:Uncharacterized protein n=1 Tax=Mucilaginibacter straminoryzae TaxID=2932774 RepID=A0A9X1WZV5_9SPHI|nr:hypothetical protein [Mucilaginibacter straminoryzae]MCJ8208196.1 hypothetical protein [Mucilaginibacter straminoryzae]